MIVYRIAPNKYAGDISGMGGATHGGRWNKKGTPVLYTGVNKEIALLEIIAHISPMLIPKLNLLTLEIPDSILELKPDSLPKNWMHYPAPTILSDIAEKWVMEAKYVALKVPSCIIHTTHNYILNCQHPDYGQKVKILEQKSFPFDSSLAERTLK